MKISLMENLQQSNVLRQKLKLWERMLLINIDVVPRGMVNYFASDVSEWYVVGLGDVEDGVTGTLHESSHADVEAMVKTFCIVKHELGEEVYHVWRCEKGLNGSVALLSLDLVDGEM